MKRLIITLIALFISAVILNAETIIVNWDGTGDYLTIQEGIDAASDGDIVLVYPGTYNEHIDYSGKNIVVGSLFFTTQDPSYISQTIIDSDNPNGVVRICDLETHDAVLTGFTIQSNGVDGISCSNSSPQISYNQIRNNHLGIECIETNADISNNEIYLNEIGIKYSVGLYRSTEISDNTIRNNKSGILCWHSSPIIYHNIISANQNYGIYCTDYSNAEISSNIIEENGKGIRSSFSSYPEMNHNTIARNYIGIFINPVSSGYMINSIVSGNTHNILQEFPDDDRNELYVYYSCVEGGLPLWVFDGGGNIDNDPLFSDPFNSNYSLLWDPEHHSPCIDTGDPDTEWDADNTPPDMGAIPAIEHNYDKWELPDANTNGGWKWLCFPVLDDLYDEGDVAGYMLADILYTYILHHVEWKPLEGGDIERIEWNGQYWTNLNHIFTSPQGYKFKMSESLQEPVNLEISGFLEDPDTEIFLLGDGEDNWVGYFIERTVRVEHAFIGIWDNLYYIKTQFWTMVRVGPDTWIGTSGRPTLSYGDMAIVKCYDDCSFVWNTNTESVEPYVRGKAENFSYEEHADYTPIFVELEPEDLPDEIGVLVEGECKGAAIVEDTLTQINAYLDGNSGEIEFEMYYSDRSSASADVVKDYFVFNPETMIKEKRKILSDEYRDYYLVSFKGDESINISEHLIVQSSPNPFTHNTTIQYTLPQETDVNVTIYNIKGQKVKTLVTGKYAKGTYTSTWDGKNEAGRPISNGIYFYKVETDNNTIIKKMLLLR